MSLAAKLGCSVSDIWDRPDNQELRDKRRHPALLAEGDVIVIPAPRTSELTVSQGETNRFRAHVPTTKLRLRLVAPETDERTMRGAETHEEAGGTVHRHAEVPKERNEQPMGGVAYRLEIGGRVYEGETKGDGKLEVSVPAAATLGKLTIAPGTKHELVSTVHVGQLGPHDERDGILHRLQNLGLTVMHDADNPAKALAVALSVFQAKYGLTITGELDSATRSALLDRHGV
ncbi:MAG: peptidoglycan-binding domain-containing protein [Polyangiaceae bacterium]